MDKVNKRGDSDEKLALVEKRKCCEESLDGDACVEG